MLIHSRICGLDCYCSIRLFSESGRCAALPVCMCPLQLQEMERVEAQLLARLKATQVQQEAAYGQLEAALRNVYSRRDSSGCHTLCTTDHGV